MAALQFSKPTAIPPLKNDDSVPEIYADSFTGVVVSHGNLNLTFAALRADHSLSPPTNFRKVVNRLVLPASVAVELHTYLGPFMFVSAATSPPWSSRRSIPPL